MTRPSYISPIVRPLSLDPLHGSKRFVIHDAKFLRISRHPFSFRIWPTDTFTGVGILDKALPVPNDSARIKLVLQDAIHPFSATGYGGCIPSTCPWPRNPLAVERHGDLSVPNHLLGNLQRFSARSELQYLQRRAVLAGREWLDTRMICRLHDDHP